MKNRALFEVLAKRAVDDTSPDINIAGNVIGVLRIGHAKPVYIAEKSMMRVAGLSAAAAACFVILATVMYSASASPLTELAQSISWVAK